MMPPAGFVGLNIGKLEQRLLAEQRRAMELEQEMLMLQVGKPSISILPVSL
jgi:hypothetical protein